MRIPVIAYVQIVDAPSDERGLGDSGAIAVSDSGVRARPPAIGGAAPQVTPHTIDLRTTLAAAKLAHHLEWYAINGFETVTLDEIVDDKLDLGKTARRVALTFDGGFESHYRLVLPLLQRFHMRATFFVPRDMIDRPGGLSRAELEIMAKWGMAFGVLVPPAADILRMLPPAVGPELSDPRRHLESLITRPVNIAATQARHVEGPILRTLRAHDYRAAAISDMGNHGPREGGIFVISRYFHRKSVNLDEWKQIAKLDAKGPAKLFFHVRNG